MELSEFLNRGKPSDNEVKVEDFINQDVEAETDETGDFGELDVQKAVVESLAADKVAQEEQIVQLKKDNEDLQAANQRLQNEVKDLQEKMKPMQDQIDPLQKEITNLKAKMQVLQSELAKVGDILLKNKEGELSNKVTLLERNTEIDDRFEGETRDQVIEVLREGRDAAEKDGRFRRAQILEAVLVGNEPSGELAKRRSDLEKMFRENANVVSGTVIEELKKRGLSHKNGEDYLLPSEIIKRNY